MKPGGDFELFTPLRAVIGGQGQMDRQRDGRLALLGFESSDLIKSNLPLDQRDDALHASFAAV